MDRARPTRGRLSGDLLELAAAREVLVVRLCRCKTCADFATRGLFSRGDSAVKGSRSLVNVSTDLLVETAWLTRCCSRKEVMYGGILTTTSSHLHACRQTAAHSSRCTRKRRHDNQKVVALTCCQAWTTTLLA